MNPNMCVHFTGIFGHNDVTHRTCKAGVSYDSMRDATQPGPYCWPCLPGIGGKVATTTCDKRRLPTVEELAADEREWREALAKIDAGRSPCCDAELNESRVRNGTGPRFCSKCKTLVFQGCARIGEEL